MVKKYFEFLDIPDGNGGVERRFVRDSEAYYTGLVFEENSSATATTPPSVSASSSTMGKIYLVGPSSGTKYQWITEEDDSTTPSTYSWQQIGDTDVDFTSLIASEQSVRDIVKDYITS